MNGLWWIGIVLASSMTAIMADTVEIVQGSAYAAGNHWVETYVCEKPFHPSITNTTALFSVLYFATTKKRERNISFTRHNLSFFLTLQLFLALVFCYDGCPSY
jgi:hypothetical protein